MCVMVVGGLRSRRSPIFQFEDVLKERSGQREVNTQHGGECFAKIPDCPCRGEGVGEGLIFVFCGREDLLAMSGEGDPSVFRLSKGDGSERDEKRRNKRDIGYVR
jgi:hypothetical protein